MTAPNYLQNQLVDHLLRTPTFAKPANVYVGANTGDPGRTGAHEIVAAGYVRVNAGPPGNAKWTATQGGVSGASSGISGQSTNAIVVAFAGPVSADWGMISYLTLWDAASGGNCVGIGLLAFPVLISQGDAPPSFPIGTIVVKVL